MIPWINTIARIVAFLVLAVVLLLIVGSTPTASLDSAARSAGSRPAWVAGPAVPLATMEDRYR